MVKKKIGNIIAIPLTALALLTTAGCVGFNTASDSSQTVDTSVPYYPPNIKDILVPGEIEYRRDNSMFINTTSFNGGVLNFEGRVDADSLTNFFIASMEKNGWKHAGSVRSKSILLAFVKPNKNCMVNITDPGYGMKTKVDIYLSEDSESGAPARQDDYLRR